MCDNTKNLPHVPITKMDRTISTLLKYRVTIIKFAMVVNHEFDLKTTSKLTFRGGFMIKEHCKTGPNILGNNSATEKHIYFGYVLPIYWEKKIKLDMLKQMVWFVRHLFQYLSLLIVISCYQHTTRNTQPLLFLPRYIFRDIKQSAYKIYPTVKKYLQPRSHFLIGYILS